MDQIYSCAALTVIANNETNANYGLPGVNSISRAPQPTFQIGSEEYTFCWFNTREIVEHSEWSTRGWTFQEALLSTRKLVFTENQAYFQCQRKVYLESLEMPATGPSDKWKAFPDHDVQTWDNSENLAARIAEYWPRKLAFKSDRYKALQGVLRSFSQMDESVQNIYGIPMFKMFASPSSMAKALLYGLCWRNPNPLSRNSIFPSWTWVGWEITTEYINEKSLWPLSHDDDGGGPEATLLCDSISVVFDASTSLDLDERFDDILERSLLKGSPPCLTLSSVLFEVELSDGGSPTMVGVGPLPKGWEGSATKIDHPEAGRPEGLRRCLCLPVMITHDFLDSKDRDSVHVLYLSLKDLPSQTYERIGTGKLSIPKGIKLNFVLSPTNIVGLENVRRQIIRVE